MSDYKARDEAIKEIKKKNLTFEAQLEKAFDYGWEAARKEDENPPCYLLGWTEGYWSENIN